MDELVELSASQLRLDTLLDQLGEESMMLSQLDGYLCGIASAPELIPAEEWMPLVWGGEAFAFPDIDQSELTALVNARYGEICAELAEERYEPLYEVDDDDETAVLWEVWVFGFELAMSLRLAAWNKLLKSHKESQAQEAAFAVMSLLDATNPDLDEAERNSPQFLAFVQDAPRIIPEIAATLYRAHRLTAPQAPIRTESIGRNDPCPCGSGQKYKRCHGAA